MSAKAVLAKAAAAAAAGQLASGLALEPDGAPGEYAIHFQAIDPETARPAANTSYILTREDGTEHGGTTDGEGYTETIETATPENVAVHFVFTSPIGNKITREELV